MPVPMIGTQLALAEMRQDIYGLLRKGTNHKLLFGNTDVALEALERAWELLSTSHPLPEPWPSLTAYRLAHLLLRTAGDNEDTLLRADELLTGAVRARSLVPMPALYHLAVLHRLGGLVKPEKIGAAYSRAMEAVKQSILKPECGEGSTAEIQSPYFNMLELASYFMRLPYTPLEGLGGNFSDELDPEASPWVVVGPEAAMSAIRFPKDLAIEELDSLAESRGVRLVFRLSADHDCHWKIPDSRWKRAGYRCLLMLACMLSGRVSDSESLRRVVIGEDESPSTFRQIKKRLLDGLGQLLDLPPSEILSETTVQGLRPGLAIYGAVEDRLLPFKSRPA